VDGKDAKWSLADRVEPYGSALTVELESAVAKDAEVDVDVSLIRKETLLFTDDTDGEIGSL
jgi:hypothetical protein